MKLPVVSRPSLWEVGRYNFLLHPIPSLSGTIYHSMPLSLNSVLLFVQVHLRPNGTNTYHSFGCVCSSSLAGLANLLAKEHRAADHPLVAATLDASASPSIMKLDSLASMFRVGPRSPPQVDIPRSCCMPGCLRAPGSTTGFPCFALSKL